MGFCLALAAHPWLWKRFYGGGWVEDEERLRVAQIELGLLELDLNRAGRGPLPIDRKGSAASLDPRIRGKG